MPIDDRITFSIVITTRNRARQLTTLLAALAALRFPKDRFEAVIVDDGGDESLDGALAAVSGAIQMRMLRREAGGPARGRNTGARAARGRFLAFIDDDCVPEPEWLQALATVHQERIDAMIGGRTLNGLLSNPFSAASQFITDIVYRHYNRGAAGPRFFASNNMAVPRERFLSLGGFDEDFSFACEDRDLCARWKEAGLPRIYEPAAVVRHSHDLRFASYCRQHFAYGRGAFHFHRKVKARGTGRLRDHFGFHLRLPYWFVIAWRRAPGAALRLWGLLLVWQVVNAAGYTYERVRRAWPVAVTSGVIV
ncbi:MAG: glycosyltransferase [Bryobacteraceae bacterium]